MPNSSKTSPREAVEALGAALLRGPCCITAYRIYVLARTGEIASARREYQCDGDKVSSYAKEVYNVLGCRLHFTIGCKQPFCRNPNED